MDRVSGDDRRIFWAKKVFGELFSDDRENEFEHELKDEEEPAFDISSMVITEEDLKLTGQDPLEIVIRNKGKEESKDDYEEYLRNLYERIGISNPSHDGVRESYLHEVPGFEGWRRVVTPIGVFILRTENYEPEIWKKPVFIPTL